MEFEGDERVTSGYSRFPPLPRVPGNETVNWKCKAQIAAYPFDKVWTLSTAHDLEAIAEDERMTELLGNDLLNEIDEKQPESGSGSAEEEADRELAEIQEGLERIDMH
jgi:hypothetical protein